MRVKPQVKGTIASGTTRPKRDLMSITSSHLSCIAAACFTLSAHAAEPLVVKIGHRFTGNEVLVPVSKVGRISYDDSTVFVNLTKEAVGKSPAHHLAPLGAANLESIVL